MATPENKIHSVSDKVRNAGVPAASIDTLTELHVALLLSVPPRIVLDCFPYQTENGERIFSRHEVSQILNKHYYAPSLWIDTSPIDVLSEPLFPPKIIFQAIGASIPLTRTVRPAFYVIGPYVRFQKHDILQWLARGRPRKIYKEYR